MYYVVNKKVVLSLSYKTEISFVVLKKIDQVEIEDSRKDK